MVGRLDEALPPLLGLAAGRLDADGRLGAARGAERVGAERAAGADRLGARDGAERAAGSDRVGAERAAGAGRVGAERADGADRGADRGVAPMDGADRGGADDRADGREGAERPDGADRVGAALPEGVERGAAPADGADRVDGVARADGRLGAARSLVDGRACGLTRADGARVLGVAAPPRGVTAPDGRALRPGVTEPRLGVAPLEGVAAEPPRLPALGAMTSEGRVRRGAAAPLGVRAEGTPLGVTRPRGLTAAGAADVGRGLAVVATEPRGDSLYVAPRPVHPKGEGRTVATPRRPFPAYTVRPPL